jgi:hypothetical protein
MIASWNQPLIFRVQTSKVTETRIPIWSAQTASAIRFVKENMAYSYIKLEPLVGEAIDDLFTVQRHEAD